MRRHPAGAEVGARSGSRCDRIDRSGAPASAVGSPGRSHRMATRGVASPREGARDGWPLARPSPRQGPGSPAVALDPLHPARQRQGSRPFLAAVRLCVFASLRAFRWTAGVRQPEWHAEAQRRKGRRAQERGFPLGRPVGEEHGGGDGLCEGHARQDAAVPAAGGSAFAAGGWSDPERRPAQVGSGQGRRRDRRTRLRHPTISRRTTAPLAPVAWPWPQSDGPQLSVAPGGRDSGTIEGFTRSREPGTTPKAAAGSRPEAQNSSGQCWPPRRGR